MRILFVLLTFGAFVSSRDWFGFQDIGPYTLVLKSALLRCKLDKNLNLNVSETELYVYDFENDLNRTFYLNAAAEALANDATFDPLRRTIMYIPGFNHKDVNSGNTESVIRNLRNISDIYLYIVDHSKYTADRFILTAYDKAVRHYYDIGIAIAKFLCKMIESGIKADDIMVLGHSLGGHIAGAAGEVLQEQCGEIIADIKGIDPAGPCFDKADKTYQLRSGLAKHTETYHCNSNQLGTENDLTDAYYYVNNGQSQPFCYTPGVPEIILSAQASHCAHHLCPNVVTLSATNDSIWQALPCNSYDDFRDSTCSQTDTVIAGIFSNSTNRGKYYISTEDHIKGKHFGK